MYIVDRIVCIDKAFFYPHRVMLFVLLFYNSKTSVLLQSPPPPNLPPSPRRWTDFSASLATCRDFPVKEDLEPTVHSLTLPRRCISRRWRCSRCSNTVRIRVGRSLSFLVSLGRPWFIQYPRFHRSSRCTHGGHGPHARRVRRRLHCELH